MYLNANTCVTEQLDQTDTFDNKTFCDSSIAFDNPGNPVHCCSFNACVYIYIAIMCVLMFIRLLMLCEVITIVKPYGSM